jgi:serine/threonine-protein kinase
MSPPTKLATHPSPYVGTVPPVSPPKPPTTAEGQTTPGMPATPLRVYWPESVVAEGLSSAPVRLGRFNDYELLETIAEGGMGVVYKARDMRLDRVVALKTLRKGELARQEDLLRFQRESKAQAKLNHPYILPVLDVGTCEGLLYFTMPYVAGGCLAARRKEFTADHHRTAELVAKVAEAVEHAHQHGILHRDLKPGNILLDEQGNPLLVDFGLAKAQDASLALTRHDQIVGTPAYMAPEQICQGPDNLLTPQTDVWSLGVLLFELATGELPFNASHAEDVIRQVQLVAPPAPRSLKPGMDPSLEAIILRCLEKDPDLRYPSAAALAEDLRRWLAGGKVQAGSQVWRRRLRRMLTSACSAKTVASVLFVTLAAVCVWMVASSPAVHPETMPRSGDADKERPPEPLWRLPFDKPLTLVDAQGTPKEYRVLQGNPLFSTSVEQERKAWVCLSSDHTLVELARAPLPERYRLEAEVLHLKNAVGTVGLFLCYQDSQTSKGRYQVFRTLSFEDRPIWPDNLVWACALHAHLNRHLSVGPQKSFRWALHASTRFDPQPGPLWHKLRADVQLDKVEVYWDSTLIATVQTNKTSGREAAAERVRAKNLEADGFPQLSEFPQTAFHPSGSMGLLVYETQAAFRNVVIRPLP